LLFVVVAEGVVCMFVVLFVRANVVMHGAEGGTSIMTGVGRFQNTYMNDNTTSQFHNKQPDEKKRTDIKKIIITHAHTIIFSQTHNIQQKKQ